MQRLLIYRGDRPSESAFALRNALVAAGFKARVNKRGNTPVLPARWKALNWGVSDCSWIPTGMWNHPTAVGVAVDKLLTFDVLRAEEVRVPDYDDELGQQRRGKWLARTQLRGSGGEGIVVIREGDPVPAADLYVKYVPKLHEYRVHVVNDRVVAVQQKRKRDGVEQTEDQALIRNAANGWVFCVDNVVFSSPEVERDVRAQSLNAVKALGLKIGAVDVIVGRDDDKAYVLECNTAPGLESPTVINAYVDTLGEWLNG